MRRFRSRTAALTLLLLAATVAFAAPPVSRRRPLPRSAPPASRGAGADSVPVPAQMTQQRPKLFLSWHAPYGAPGAALETPVACDDPAHVDTLFVSFEPTRDDTSFTGMAGEVNVFAQGGDTLGGFWDMAGGGTNRGGMTMQFTPHADFPGESPWNRGGMAVVRFERTSASARFRFFNVVPTGSGIALRAGHRYTIGCVLIRQAEPTATAGCDRPVCLELGQTDFSFNGQPDIFQHGSNQVARGTSSERCRHHLPVWRPVPGAKRPAAPVPASGQ